MRTDLASMNAGKAVAQGSHASNLFQSLIQEGSNDTLKGILAEWMGDRKFGTCITLGADDRQMRKVVDDHAKYQEHHNNSLAGLVLDPTYPLRDGSFTHLIPLHTCAFLFGYKEDISYLTTGLELMP